MTTRVVAFDSWTGGVANLARLVDAFARRDLDLMLIHIGSWGHDRGRPIEERIGRVLVRDIRYYRNQSLRSVLQAEAPAAVLFLSTQAFVHRAVNRYCIELGIPTVHLFHGFCRVQPTSSKRLNPINPISQIALIRSRAGKLVQYVLPAYARALWDTGAPVKDWLRFGYDIWLQAVGRSYSGLAARDTSTTACCVYTEGDAPYAVERYRMPRGSVYAVGNADIIKFRLQESDLGACLAQHRTCTPDVVYIDTALIESGSAFAGPKECVDHLRETSEALSQQGFRLVAKLHPAHGRTGVPELLKKTGVRLCGDEEFVPQLKSACAAITEPSSAAIIAALLGLPLFLARYGNLRQQEYGEILAAYPRAMPLDSLDSFSGSMRNLSKATADLSAREWISANAGPMPAEMMPERVADIVAMVGSRSACPSNLGNARGCDDG